MQCSGAGARVITALLEQDERVQLAGNMSERANRKGKPLLIGIAGGSGAGKSWLAERIAQHFGKESSPVLA